MAGRLKETLKSKDGREKLLSFPLCFFLVILRFCYYGLRYFPQLDDYIQYMNFGAATDKWGIVESAGMLSTRPLAGLCDVYVWSNFSGCLFLVVIILSALFAASALLFRRALSRYFTVGYGFLVVYLLLPLGTEGTYWLSASTRIICGLFFLSLSAFLFAKFAESKKARHLVLCGAAQLVAFCFYEQVLVLSFALIFLLFLCELFSKKEKKILFSLIPIAANPIIYFTFTGLSKSSGIIASRTELIFPFADPAYYFNSFFPLVTEQIKTVFHSGGLYTCARGFLRGAKIILADGGWLFAALLAAAAVCVFLFSRRAAKGEDKRKILLPLLLGVLLTLAPLFPFLVVASVWFSFRGAVTSFLGLAIIADTLLHLISFKNANAYAAFVTAAATVFSVAAVSEIHDYKATYDSDSALLSAVVATYNDSGDAGLHIGVIGAEESYLSEQNYYFHEHIHGVAESDWAMTGAFCHYTGDGDAVIVPLSLDGEFYSYWEASYSRLSTLDALYVYDSGSGSAARAEFVRIGDEEYEIYLGGRLYAVTHEINATGFIDIVGK